MTQLQPIVKQEAPARHSIDKPIITQVSTSNNEVETINPDILTFISTLYQGMAGWCEVSVIMGDPSARRAGAGKKRGYSITQLEGMSTGERQELIGQWGHVFGREWHCIDGANDMHRVAVRMDNIGREFGNVYTTDTLYTTAEKRVEYAQPTRVLFIDDAPAKADVPYSMLVQTSPRSFHGYYFLTEKLSNADRQEMKAASAIHLGGDKSGADVTQIVRVPATLNTKAKYGGSFPVRLVYSNGPAHILEQFEKKYTRAVVSVRNALPLIDVELWLGNISELLKDGLPRRIKNDVIKSNFANAHQSTDTSSTRYSLCKSLIYVGYPDDEIAALLAHFAPAPHKPAQWFMNDVARLITKLRADITPRDGISPSGNRANRNAPALALPVIEPKPKHRPQRITAAMLLEWYVQQSDASIVQLTQKEAAAAVGISKPQLQRLERDLTADGHIQRVTQRAGGNRSWVVIGPEGSIRSTPKVASEVGVFLTSDATLDVENMPLGRGLDNSVEMDVLHLSTHAPDVAPTIPTIPATPTTRGACVLPVPAGDAPDDLLNIANDLLTDERFAEYEALKAEYPQLTFATDERFCYRKYIAMKYKATSAATEQQAVTGGALDNTPMAQSIPVIKPRKPEHAYFYALQDDLRVRTPGDKSPMILPDYTPSAMPAYSFPF